MNKVSSRQRRFTGVMLLTVFGLGACASIMHGTRQDVGITSAPSGATVTIDNIPSGITPVIAHVARNSNHIVRVEMPGYQPFDLTLTHSVSGWVWGNVAFGGLIGLAVDAISGGMYKLSPEQLAASLATTTHASVSKNNDGIYVVTVLKPQPEWTKLAQLQVH